MSWRVIEKDNPLAVHAVCDSRAGAERWVRELAPLYCARGYFANKALRPDSFVIQEKASKS